MIRVRQQFDEIIRDLRANGVRTLLLLAVLTAIAWLALAVDNEAARARASLDAAVSSPGASVVRLLSPTVSDDVGTETLIAASGLGDARGVLALGVPDAGRGALGSEVIIRDVWGDTSPTMWRVPCDMAQISPSLAARLGLLDPAGVVTHGGIPEDIAAIQAVPPGLGFLDQIVLVRRCGPDVRANELAVLLRDPTTVARTTEAVTQLLPVNVRPSWSVRSSETEIRLAQRVAATSESSRMRLLVLTSISCGLLAALMFATITTARRRDYGRRRALGATPEFILALVVGQAGALAVAGFSLAAIGRYLVVVIRGQPAPEPPFLVGCFLLVVASAATGSLLPAVAAARSNPLREVRVP
ncbi:MAG: hypothetical protein IPH03_05955 [Tetrasphaera sp.]|nr:hypothetical protein [Tetrasphaera sp.]